MDYPRSVSRFTMQKWLLFNQHNRFRLLLFISASCVVCCALLSLGYREYLLWMDARHLTIAKSSPSRNLSNDPIVVSYLKQHPVYVSLTTTPNRINHVVDILSVLDLDYVKTVWVVLPERFRAKTPYVIPKRLLAMPKVEVLRIDHDLGPLSKLLPAVEKASRIDKQALLITIDDDYIYPRGMVNEHIRSLIYSPKSVSNTIPATMGIADSQAPIHYHMPIKLLKALWPSSRPWLVQGVGSIGMVVGLFDSDLAKYIWSYSLKSHHLDCYLSDDVVISFVLHRSGVAPKLLHNDYVSHPMLQPLWASQQYGSIHTTPLIDRYFTFYKAPLHYNEVRIGRCLQVIARALNE